VHDRRGLADAIALAGLAAIVAAAFIDVSRGPAFHEYAGPRWLLVASNLPFVVVAAVARGAPWYLRAGVAAIALGSGAYHVAPCDELLALDWAPIAATLLLVLATVLGRGALPLVLAPVTATGSVLWWLAGGGTHGGNMAPYVTAQLVGVVATPLVGLARPSRADVRWLLAGVAGFALARGAALVDHSAKHVVAAGAAWCALRAFRARPSSSP